MSALEDVPTQEAQFVRMRVTSNLRLKIPFSQSVLVNALQTLLENIVRLYFRPIIMTLLKQCLVEGMSRSRGSLRRQDILAEQDRNTLARG